MVQGVIFDLDGTLLDTLRDLADAGNHTLAAMGLPGHAVDDYRRMVGNGIPKLVERMLPAHHRGAATQALALGLFLRHYGAHKLDHTAPYPGVPALLTGLQKAEVRLGVVSNKDDGPARAMVESFFPGVFHAVRGRLDGTPPKPDPALVEAVLGEWGLARAGVMYVGDSDVDILTAVSYTHLHSFLHRAHKYYSETSRKSKGVPRPSRQLSQKTRRRGTPGCGGKERRGRRASSRKGEVGARGNNVSRQLAGT